MSRAPRLPWCGQCHEDTRLMELTDGLVCRCPRCHAGAQAARAGRGLRNKRRAQWRPTNAGPDCPACGQRIYRTHKCRASGLRRQTGEEE